MKPEEIRIASRAELISYVPFALGFHPANSIVLVGLVNKLLDIAGRADADLPTRDIISMFAPALARRRCLTGVMVLGYGPPTIDGPVRTVAEALRERAYLVHEALRVADGRFHCLQCDGCTPLDGEPFDFAASTVAAAATYAGLVARPSREEIESMVRPIGGLAAVSMSQAVDRAEDRLGLLRNNAELVSAGRKALDDAFAAAKAGQPLSDDEVAWLSVLIADTSVRDHAWLHTTGEAWQLDLWVQLTRRAEPILAAPMATLLAWCGWRRGDAGALTVAAVERALRIDPHYELARLISDILLQAQPPSIIKKWPIPLPLS